MRFECTQCGNCCRNHGDYDRVYLADRDVTAIAAHLGLGEREFVARHCEREEGWIVLRTGSPACQFLLPDQRCAIYPVRPKQCATWPFWEEHLAERANWEGPVSDCCPGIGQGPLVPAAEAERIAQETEAWYEDD